MNLWQKLTLGCKFLFGGFESATDYLLGILNGWLTKPTTAEMVSEIYRKAASILALLNKYSCFCPAKWLAEWNATLGAVENVVAAFADGKVTPEETAAAVAGFKSAYDAWMQED